MRREPTRLHSTRPFPTDLYGPMRSNVATMRNFIVAFQLAMLALALSGCAAVGPAHYDRSGDFTLNLAAVTR